MTMLPPESLDERPAVAGGSLFRTHRVVESGDRLELVPSVAADREARKFDGEPDQRAA